MKINKQSECRTIEFDIIDLRQMIIAIQGQRMSKTFVCTLYN